MAKHTPLNTFKICEPDGSEYFTYSCIMVFNPPITINGKRINVLELYNREQAKKFIDFYVDYTDYTLYNTKLLTFHHLN